MLISIEDILNILTFFISLANMCVCVYACYMFCSYLGTLVSECWVTKPSNAVARNDDPLLLFVSLWVVSVVFWSWLDPLMLLGSALGERDASVDLRQDLSCCEHWQAC